MAFKKFSWSRYEPYLYFLPTGILISIFIFYPLLRQALLAFQHYLLLDPKNVYFSFENFQRMVTDEVFWRALKNTGVWTLTSVFFQFTLGFSLALLLNKPFKGRGFFRSIVVLPWAVPPFLIGLIFAWLYHGRVGVINDVLIKLALIERPIAFLAGKHLALYSIVGANVWFGIPFFIIVLLASLQSIPEALYEAAAIDGATVWQKFMGVTLPLMRPAILNSILLRTIWIVNFGDIIYMMTKGGPAHRTETLVTYLMYIAYYEHDFGYGAALSVSLTVVFTLYTLLFLRLTRSAFES